MTVLNKKSIFKATLTAALMMVASTSFAASVKIINDTGNSIQLHTGSGVANLPNKGSSTSVSCKAGKKIYRAEGGSKRELLFTLSSDDCGDTIKLSDVM